ncbi:MAG: hypothetical protein HY343_07445 [Lentisphaerae bacterium]|nr:hypothetical protein [Lentisphaerota bacterium]
MAGSPQHPEIEGSEPASGSNLSLIIFSIVGVVAALLFMGIVAFQVMEHLYYREPPSVWPTPAAAGRQPLTSPAAAAASSREGPIPTGLTSNAAPPDSAMTETGSPSPSAVSEPNSGTNAPDAASFSNAPAASGEAQPDVAKPESPP